MTMKLDMSLKLCSLHSVQQQSSSQTLRVKHQDESLNLMGGINVVVY
jgi:hypothetical protein